MAWLNEHKPVVLLGLILVTLFGGGLFYTRGTAAEPAATALTLSTPSPTATPTPTPTVTATPSPTPTATPAPLRVYVSGAVQTPDVYRLPPNSIIKDALLAAGGPTEEADLAAVNLALVLQDQQQIHIPALRDEAPTPPMVRGGNPVPATQTSNTASSATPGPTATPRLININQANLNELTLITGVGPATAQKIIAYREEHGPFSTLEGIMEVKGIGPVTFEKMKAQLTLN